MNDKRIIIGFGTGRCGLTSLTETLNRQASAGVSYYQPPFLPWQRSESPNVVPQRLEMLLRRDPECVPGDVASFYLLYLEEMIQSHPGIRAVCLKRPCEESVTSFCRWLDRYGPLRYDHWSNQSVGKLQHDPVWTRIYPQYETSSREDGLRRYWHEYYQRAEELAEQFPEQVRMFDMAMALNSESGLRDLLSFVGIPEGEQVVATGVREKAFEDSEQPQPRAPVPSNHPLDPRRCLVLVPFNSPILPQCEDSLRALEQRGYPVRRVGGFAAIDQGRNQLATDAMMDGFEETMWVDSDVSFDPASVDQLRAHQLPICCGIYSQKGKRSIAAHVLPGTPQIEFGQDGGLLELLYAATGFLHVRREVYSKMQKQLDLQVCNERFERPMVTYFQPMTIEFDSGSWYLAEDYSFSHRARQCGYKIMADTTIRLWHHGMFRYGWEDSGREVDRYTSFTLNLPDGPERKSDQSRPV
ncbi:MAG: hypothetical protein O3C40_16095 [Planctomycetota bacterium]|nr:hypothetical protein [Planctomycetota bacterium]